MLARERRSLLARRVDSFHPVFDVAPAMDRHARNLTRTVLCEVPNASSCSRRSGKMALAFNGVLRSSDISVPGAFDISHSLIDRGRTVKTATSTRSRPGSSS
jgi:hypothetical protein